MKTRICKGCGLPLLKPTSSLQSVHNYNCLKKWNKTKVKTKEQKLRKQAGLDVDAQRRKCDALFQQVGKLLNPRSIISGDRTEVIHHRIKKSESNNLRYCLENGVPLTNTEHGSIDKGNSSIELEIDAKMGQKWLDFLNLKRRIIYKLTMPNLLEVEIELRKKLCTK